jgi:hypothetical protein
MGELCQFASTRRRPKGASIIQLGLRGENHSDIFHQRKHIGGGADVGAPATQNTQNRHRIIEVLSK